MSASGNTAQAKVGDRLLVFDAFAWLRVGDQGDNSHFRKPATIERVYRERSGDLCANVRWDDGTFSDGHLISAMRPL